MTETIGKFDSEFLRGALAKYPGATRYVLGFSGGADSTALLLGMCELRPDLDAPIEAVHFNHGLHPEAMAWQQHCERFCAARGIPLRSYLLRLDPDQPNLESAARQERYRLIERQLGAGALYLTGHHADDRAETFLLHALRGSGIEGLASIPEIRPLGRGHVARPLLSVDHEALEAYLITRGAEWIEDPSNQDTGLDRNFVRHEVLPLLESRWPAAKSTLARTAAHMRTASGVLAELLARAFGHLDLDGSRLPLSGFEGMGSGIQSMLLRHWLCRHDAPTVPEARLKELLSQLSSATSDSHCEIAWQGWSLRQHGDNLHLIPPGELPACPETAWTAGPSVRLGPELGELQLRGTPQSVPPGWQVGPRRAGFRFRQHEGGRARKMKKVFQEQPIPPWLRASVPVLYWDGQAVAIGDWQLSSRLAEWLADHHLEYRWLPLSEQLKDLQNDCRSIRLDR